MALKGLNSLKLLIVRHTKFEPPTRHCHAQAIKQSQDSNQLQSYPQPSDVKLPTIEPPKRIPQDLATRTFHNDLDYRKQVDEKQTTYHRSFKYSDMEIELAHPSVLKPKPDVGDLVFGKTFTDHMLRIYYHKSLGGWQKPQIVPLQNLSLHPAAKALHYALQLFEGTKAYRGVDDHVRTFRLMLNMERMNASASRIGLPTFDSVELARSIMKLVSIDQEWVPHNEAGSLYIRPTLMGIEGTLGVQSAESALLYTILSPVGNYFSNDIKAISVLAEPKYVRAWQGGSGDRKLGSNYGPTIQAQTHAHAKGHQQPLWLFGEDCQVTEAGTMNVFLLYVNDYGERELITSPLNGLILPGVLRHSVLQLTRSWGDLKVTERTFTMYEIIELLNKNRLLEMFGVGTACAVTAFQAIEFNGERLEIPTLQNVNPVYEKVFTVLKQIQYGYMDHPWADVVD